MVNAYSSVVIIDKYREIVDSYAAKHTELKDSIVKRVEGLVRFVFDNIHEQANIGCKTWRGRLYFRDIPTPIDDELLEIVKKILKNEFDINLEKEKTTLFITGREMLRRAGEIPKNFETECQKPVIATLGDHSSIVVKPTIADIAITRPVITYSVFDNFMGELAASLKNQRRRMLQLARDGKFTDLDIVVDDRIFHLHRVILATSSDFFEKLLLSVFCESKADSIPLIDITPRTFEFIMEFIYLQECSFLEDNSLSIEDKIRFCFEVINAADRFQLSDLFNITSVFICGKNILNNDNVLQILDLSAKSHQYATILDACLFHLYENIDVLVKCEIEKLKSILELAGKSESKTLDLIVQHALARIIDDSKTTKEIFDKIHDIAVKKRGPILDLCLWHLRRGHFS